MTYDEINSLSVGFVVRKYHISAVDWHYKPINQGIRALSSRNRIEKPPQGKLLAPVLQT
jgi:hypothetical protein